MCRNSHPSVKNMYLGFLVSAEEGGCEIISNHGLTLELKEFNGVKALEEGILCFGFIAGFVVCLFLFFKPSFYSAAKSIP